MGSSFHSDHEPLQALRTYNPPIGPERLQLVCIYGLLAPNLTTALMSEVKSHNSCLHFSPWFLSIPIHLNLQPQKRKQESAPTWKYPERRPVPGLNYCFGYKGSLPRSRNGKAHSYAATLLHPFQNAIKGMHSSQQRNCLKTVLKICLHR